MRRSTKIVDTIKDPKFKALRAFQNSNSPKVPSSRDSTSDVLDTATAMSLAMDTDTNLIKKIQTRFPNFSRHDRQNLIITLIKLCDPVDMAFLHRKIPKLHRDFINNLPTHVVHKILGYVHPKDYCAIVQVSKGWMKASTDLKLWQKLYARLGLVAMANAYYLPDAPMLVNAKRLYSLGNWAKGNFIFKQFRAHPLGILCIAFDGKYIAVRQHLIELGQRISAKFLIDWEC